jgi:hypothetical protein
LRARYRLGPEAAIAGIQVFAFAFDAKRKCSHRRGIAVIGKRLNYCEPRPARSAVGKWIAVTSRGEIEDFAHVFRTDREIGRDGSRRTRRI